MHKKTNIIVALSNQSHRLPMKGPKVCLYYMLLEMSGWRVAGSGQYGYSGSAMDINPTSSLTCEQLQALGNPLLLSPTVANALCYIQITYYMICYPTAFLLNAFVIFIIAHFKKLRTTTFYLTLQIIVANLANIAVYFPYSTANAITNRDIFA